MTDLIQQIESIEAKVGVRHIGTPLEAGEGIARLQDLVNVRVVELVQFEKWGHVYGV